MDSDDRILIRPWRPEDTEAVQAIRLQPSVIAGTLALPSERLTDRQTRQTRYGPDDHLFVAEIGGHIVGMAGLHVGSGKKRHGGEIGMLVDEGWQRRGVGTSLLAALLDLADNYLGLSRVELEVVADNEPAIRLYERHGFELEGRKRQAIWRLGGPADLLVMARLR